MNTGRYRTQAQVHIDPLPPLIIPTTMFISDGTHLGGDLEETLINMT